MTQKKIDLFGFYSENITALKRNFEISLNDIRDSGICAHIERVDLPAGYSDISDIWRYSCMVKVEKMISRISRNRGSLMIYSDMDIVFFRKISSAVVMCMRGRDMVFQREHHESVSGDVNAGFVAMVCNENVLKVWISVRDEYKKRPWDVDQTVVNEFLRGPAPGVKWGYFPYSFSAVSHQGVYPPVGAVLMHANTVLDMGSKLKILSRAAYIIRKPLPLCLLRSAQAVRMKYTLRRGGQIASSGGAKDPRSGNSPGMDTKT
jgi:hypothetical protein